MTKEEFMDIIDGFEDELFIITMGGKETSPLKYIKALSDSVKVISNGKPAIYKFADIGGLSFDINGSKTNNILETADYRKMTDDSGLIALSEFPFVDRYEEIRSNLRGTKLEREWTRTQNMIKDARKNHVLPEKVRIVVTILRNLIVDYPCIELHQLLGEAYSYVDDWENACSCFENAGDYPNAAYFAQKCQNNSQERLFSILEKWIISPLEHDEKVYSSFFSLAKKIHRGRDCYEILKDINITKQPKSVNNVIYHGLLAVFSDYHTNQYIDFKNNSILERIGELLEMLKSETSYEKYTPVVATDICHASELFEEEGEEEQTKSDGSLSVGYIIRTFDYSGFIGKSKNSQIGVHFNKNDISSPEILNIYSGYHTVLNGMKVSYIPSQILFNGKVRDIAKNIQPLENVTDFLSRQRINYIPSSNTTDEQSKELIKNSDGTYSGYIIKFKGNFGFIAKDPNEKNGVYFYYSDLSEQLLTIKDHLVGLKVKCELVDIERENGKEKNAIKIDADEDIKNFMKRVPQKIQENEVVDEKEIEKELRENISPSAVVQRFMTNGKPLHALIALEKSKDNFTYDKYVKHKIQLLQRTKTDDNELMKLLNYTITTSQDGSYVAHNLFFLGQVQFRNKQYSDVIQTMKNLEKYKKDIKFLSTYNDSLYYIAVSYYMLKEYSKSDDYAKKLQSLNLHPEDVRKLLDRTFASAESDYIDNIDEESEQEWQFDTEVRLTPFIEQLISNFSFGSISLKGIPADFDPELDNVELEQAEKYIEKLSDYNKDKTQRNSPNAYIAMAKIEKWIAQKTSESQKKEEKENSLRSNISNALQIMARKESDKSTMDIRVHLFYRMQQYEMSVQSGKNKLFNAYVNVHYGILTSRYSRERLKISDNLKDKDYLLMVSDILLLHATVEQGGGEKRQIQELCNIIDSRHDRDFYRDALCQVINHILPQSDICPDTAAMWEQATDAMKSWLRTFKKDISERVEAKQWSNLFIRLNSYMDTPFLSQNEKEFMKNVCTIVDHINSAEQNTSTAMKMNFINQSLNLLDETIENLTNKPTYITYSIFTDILQMLKNTSTDIKSEVMSHKPNIVPVSSRQINLGLTDMKEFILPLEFQNKFPAIQAQFMKIEVGELSQGVELLSELPQGQNVNEGEKYSQSLKFRLNMPDSEQINISIHVSYYYETFDRIKRNPERSHDSKKFEYTISFQDVPVIENKYKSYARKQGVKDKSMFFGRDQDIQKIFDAITVHDENNVCSLIGGNGFVLFGQRRSGKTSILDYLLRKIVSEAKYTIIVDFGSSGKSISKKSEALTEEELQNQNAKMTLQLMYHKIISDIKNYIEFNNNNIAEIGELDQKIQNYQKKTNKEVFPSIEDFKNYDPQILFNDFLEVFSQIIKSDDSLKKFRVVIFIDEFTYFNAAIQEKKLPSNFMEIWKGILADSLITLVVAGQDNMIEFMSSYANEFMSFDRLWVTFLLEEYSKKMIMEPIGENRIDVDAAHKLHIFTAGSPFLLMDVCSELVNWMNMNKILKLSGSLPDDFLIVYMNNHEFNEDLLQPLYVDAGRPEWESDIKMVLGLIARGTSKGVLTNIVPWNEYDEYANVTDDMLEDNGISADKMCEILERLVKREVIEKKDGSQDKYRIKIPLCREWILRRGGSEYGNK